MYTAHVLRSIGNPNLPQPGRKGFRVFLPWSQKQRIIRTEQFDLAASFKEARIYPEQLKGGAASSVMLFRPSMRRDVEKADCLDGAALIYSLWSGHLGREQYKPFLKWLDEKGIPLVHCHTSGHAPVSDLKRLAEALAPKVLVPVHSCEPERFAGLFGNVQSIADGERWQP